MITHVLHSLDKRAFVIMVCEAQQLLRDSLEANAQRQRARWCPITTDDETSARYMALGSTEAKRAVSSLSKQVLKSHGIVTAPWVITALLPSSPRRGCEIIQKRHIWQERKKETWEERDGAMHQNLRAQWWDKKQICKYLFLIYLIPNFLWWINVAHVGQRFV